MDNEHEFLKEKSQELSFILVTTANEYLEKLNEIHDDGAKIFSILETAFNCSYFSFILAFCQKEGLDFTNKLTEQIQDDFNKRIKLLRNTIRESIQ